MQIERAMAGIETLGPGKRLVIWVNGCGKCCEGCVSERLRAPSPLNELEIVRFLSQYDLRLSDGVTFSGGEPFDQPQELEKAVGYLNEKGVKDILIYTGHTLEELRFKNNPAIDYVLNNIAVLIDGPYVRSLDAGLGNLKGSDNQRILFMDPDYKALYESYLKQERKMQEFHIGNIVLGVGIPDTAYIENFNETTKKHY